MTKLSQNNTLVTCENLNVSFSTGKNSTQVLHDVSFEILSNEFVAVVGESGSGKSVMSKALMGLLPVENSIITASQLVINNKEVLHFSSGDWSRFRGSVISMIFQEPMSALNPTITCGKQVAEILKQHTDLTKAQIKDKVISLFQKVHLPQPESLYHKYPHEISGGQMQRVMIAMAVACNPILLIADEPTTALDVTVQKEIIKLLKDIQQEFNMSVLFISHDLSLVRSIADKVMVMYQGHIVEKGTVQSIFNEPKERYTKALLAARPDLNERVEVLPTISDFLDNNYSKKLVDAVQRERSLKTMYTQEPLIQIKDLKKVYEVKNGWFNKSNAFTAVNGVSFDIFPGESLGLVGESGCGKSTLGNIILGLKEATSGSVLYKGTQVVGQSQKSLRKMRRQMQIIFQDPFASLNPRLTVGSAILEPMSWYKIGSSNKERELMVKELLVKVGLKEEHYYRYPHEFSGGQRQRIGIARTIALRPEFIVCDESVSALDISVQAQVLNLLNTLKHEFGFSYLFISHDLAVVKHFCDRIVVMNKGEIEEIQESEQLYKNPQKAYTKKLIQAIPN